MTVIEPALAVDLPATTSVAPSDAGPGSVGLVSRYPPLGRIHEGRGTASYTKQLATALAGLGWRVDVFAERQGDDEQHYLEDGVWVHRAWRLGWRGPLDLGQLSARFDVDVFHVQHELFVFGGRSGAFAMPLVARGLARRAPVVTTIHGVVPPDGFSPSLMAAYGGRLPRRLVRPAYSWIMREMVKSSEAVVAHGRAVMDTIALYQQPRRPVIIPHGMGAARARVSRQAALDRLGLDDRKRALFFGYLLPYKGVDVLERAAPLLARRGIEVLIAGSDSGDPTPTHAVRARHAGDNVRRLGFVPEELIPTLFAVADVLVLPYRVGLSASGPLTFAVSYGVPAVVSDVPTLVEAVSCPDAVFTRDDEVGLAEVVTRIVSTPGLAGRVTRCMKDAANGSSWVTVAEATASLYRAVCDEAPIRD